jgi:DNA-binding transcriptional ArsR family regulator
MEPSRPLVTDPAALEALAHPIRLDVLNYLMSNGPATASVCARAVGDTPSNCSYHLRVLAKHGLVEPDTSTDGRERPWRALVTGLTTDRHDPAATGVHAAFVQLEQRLVRDYLTHRDEAPEAWRAVDEYATYTLRITAAELADLTARIDVLLRPLIAATREDAPDDSELVNAGFYAFPRLEGPWHAS